MLGLFCSSISIALPNENIWCRYQVSRCLLLQFCCRAKRLYSKEVATPNMHLHCHLKQSLYDYGPIHPTSDTMEFYYYPSTNHSFEILFTNRFLQEFRLFCSLQFLPKEFESEFGDALKSSIEPALRESLSSNHT